MEQLKNNLAVAEKYKPLTDEERLELFKDLPLRESAPWKAESWTNFGDVEEEVISEAVSAFHSFQHIEDAATDFKELRS